MAKQTERNTHRNTSENETVDITSPGALAPTSLPTGLAPRDPELAAKLERAANVRSHTSPAA